jgi:signal transduction histidine kinase
MLHDFVTTHRDAIILKAREKLTARPWPIASTDEIQHGVPLFLSQLSETLKGELTETPFPPAVIGESAARHGRELLEHGYSIAQVVHDYGDICQAITEVSMEEKAEIRTDEFHTLNRCLDTAIAQAVTEHARVTALSRSSEDVERLGQLTHELRDQLNTALLAFHTLKRGTVAINGSTGAVLGRSLMALRDLVDSTLSDVRLAAKDHRRESVPLAAFLGDIAVAASLDADSRELTFTIEPIDPASAVNADPQLLSSAVMNLLTNAFKYTHAGGNVTLRVHTDDGFVRVEVEDECGGFPEVRGDPFRSFAERRGSDRTGLGLGLSIARKAVRAHGGDIEIRNLPGKGCIFTIAFPLAAAENAATPARQLASSAASSTKPAPS